MKKILGNKRSWCAALALAAALGTTAGIAPASARDWDHDGWRRGGDDHWRRGGWDRGDWRRHHYRDRGYWGGGYYGGYYAPPPPVYYAPPPVYYAPPPPAYYYGQPSVNFGLSLGF